MTMSGTIQEQVKEPLFVYDPVAPEGIRQKSTQSFALVSLFSGAGGMDIGFEQAGFRTIWANEYDANIAPSFRSYFRDVTLDTRSITQIDASEIPVADGIIGGPPCQSWSEAGARRGLNDARGQLFFDYIRILNYHQPKFFVAENVHGMVHGRNLEAFNNILTDLESCGYRVKWKVLKASDYEVPQDRERVFIVGIRKDIESEFEFPEPISKRVTIRDAIGDLASVPLGTMAISNHESTNIGFSPIFMSRNRVRGWNEQSYTILASDRHIPLHPQAPKMVDDPAEPGMKQFVPGSEALYRRLSIRECARIQTFPDEYEFLYNVPRVGYKMIGNAVPVRLAYHVALAVKRALVETKCHLK
jgi:DNA (cytosine-5)-methyltransferase 1